MSEPVDRIHFLLALSVQNGHFVLFEPSRALAGINGHCTRTIAQVRLSQASTGIYGSLHPPSTLLVRQMTTQLLSICFRVLRAT